MAMSIALYPSDASSSFMRLVIMNWTLATFWAVAQTHTTRSKERVALVARGMCGAQKDNTEKFRHALLWSRALGAALGERTRPKNTYVWVRSLGVMQAQSLDFPRIHWGLRASSRPPGTRSSSLTLYHIPRRTRHELQAHHGHVTILNRPRAGPALVCEVLV